MKVMRTKRRKVARRIVRRIVSVAAITFVMLLIVSFGVRARAGRGEPTIVTVRPGDTLWAIAERFGDQNTDIREVIYQIKRLNGLQSSAISPGLVLRIPVR